MRLEEFELKSVVMPLQKWFLANAREMPWRSDPTPYHVWISEIMLQQTRVETVRAYYKRFLEALPTVEALAACPEEKYLKLWEGLGYYSRVRNLHAAACQIMEEHGGYFPEEEKQILALKGIGSYTAGAISSIAFERPVPAVDGNVLRVMMRLSGDQSDIMEASTKKRVETVIRELMETYPAKTQTGFPDTAKTDFPDTDAIQIRPRIFTQALMELGALVCVPNGVPKCQQCPWSAFCQAHLQQLTDVIPVKKKAKERRIEQKTVLILKEQELIAIRKRPDTGLLAGLYELPNLEGHLSEETIADYVKTMGFNPLQIKKLKPAKHIFSHVEWHMIGYALMIEKKEPAATEQKTVRQCEQLLFVNAQQVEEEYAIPAAFEAYKQEILKENAGSFCC